MKTPLALALLTSLLLCLAPSARAQEAAGGAAESARRLAAEADDHASTLAARRESLQKLEEAARLALAAGAREEAARALSRAGRLLLLLNDPQAALGAHRRALSLLKKAPSAEAEADGLNGLGEVHAFLKEKADAEAALRGALAVSERAGYTRGSARALLTLSEIQNLDDHTLGLRTAQESLALWQSLGDARGLALAHSQVGRCYMAQNLLAESQLNYERALQLWQELNDPPGQADALVSLGYVEARRGEWHNFIQLLMKAQALVDEEAQPTLAGQIASGLGGAFNETGSPEKGLPHFQRALDFYRRSQDPLPVTYALWKLGCTHFLLGDYEGALARFEEVLATADKDGLFAASVYEYVGRIHIEKGEPAEALPRLRSALAVYTRASNPKEAAQVRALLARVYEQQGQTARARRGYREALAAFDTLYDRVGQAEVYHRLGRLELGEGRLAEAEGWLRRSVEVTEDLRRFSGSSELAASFSAAVHERYESYVECLMRAHAGDPSRGAAALAFESSERSRSRSLAEILRATGTTLVPGLAPQLAEQERALRRSLRAKEDERVELLGGKYERAALDALDAELARLGAEYRGLEEAIRASHPSHVPLARGDAWDLRRIQERVVADDETLLVEYSLGAERSYAWGVTRGGLKSYELPPRPLVERAVERVYALLSSRPRPGHEEELAEAVRGLSRMILSPLAEELRGRRRVVFVADGVLNYVPFRLLSASPDGGGDPLVAGHEVVNAPSASVLGQLREEAARRRPHTRALAAFGDPVFLSNYAMRKREGPGAEVAGLRQTEPGDFASHLRGVEVEGDSMNPASARPLFFAGLELANLRAAAEGADPLVASGFDATRERLQATDLSEFAVLHFATHGWLDPRRPEGTGLLLSTVDTEGRERGGFVGLRDIYSLRAPVGLVVLSACRTALGKEVRGEGMIGLTRGFMYAGASGVVSSLWKVDDEATSELMRRFYENLLRRGMTPAAALGAAQNSIRQEPRWRSPYYWAAFTLQGENRPVVRPPGAHVTSPYAKAALSAAALSLLALAACALWRLRRRRARVGLT